MNTGTFTVTLLYTLFWTGVFTLKRYFPVCRALVRDIDFGVRDVQDIRSVLERKIKEIKGIPIFSKAREDRTDRAIYEDLSYLKNLIIAHKGMVNSDFVISCLAERDGALKKAYIKMLSLMRTGRVEEAERVMYEETGTEMGKEFAFLLTSWEYMQPERLEEVIISYRQSIKETCITRQKKREELISDFIYFPATINVFVIFINFIYISYFMEQKEMFQMIL